MATFHGILAELGIENSPIHPNREEGHETGWMVDEAFEPVAGKTYQLAFGRLPFGREMRTVIRTVRIDGPAAGGGAACGLGLAAGGPWTARSPSNGSTSMKAGTWKPD